MTTVHDGLKQVGYSISLLFATYISLGISIILGLVSHKICKRIVRTAKVVPISSHQEQQLYSLQKDSKAPYKN